MELRVLLTVPLRHSRPWRRDIDRNFTICVALGRLMHGGALGNQDECRDPAQDGASSRTSVGAGEWSRNAKRTVPTGSARAQYY